MVVHDLDDLGYPANLETTWNHHFITDLGSLYSIPRSFFIRVKYADQQITGDLQQWSRHFWVNLFHPSACFEAQQFTSERYSYLWNFPWIHGNFRIRKWRYCTIFLAIFCGDIPWNLGLKNRPFFYARYLQSIGSCCMAIDMDPCSH